MVSFFDSLQFGIVCHVMVGIGYAMHALVLTADCFGNTDIVGF